MYVCYRCVVSRCVYMPWSSAKPSSVHVLRSGYVFYLFQRSRRHGTGLAGFINRFALSLHFVLIPCSPTRPFCSTLRAVRCRWISTRPRPHFSAGMCGTVYFNTAEVVPADSDTTAVDMEHVMSLVDGMCGVLCRQRGCAACNKSKTARARARPPAEQNLIAVKMNSGFRG